MRADVTIDWKAVSSYLDTVSPTHQGKAENIELAPERTTIFTNTCLGKIRSTPG